MCGGSKVFCQRKMILKSLKPNVLKRFEAVINHLSSYVEFKCLRQVSLFGKPKMDSFGLSGAKNFMEFISSNSVANSTKLLFTKHSRCGIVCKVVKFCFSAFGSKSWNDNVLKRFYIRISFRRRRRDCFLNAAFLIWREVIIYQ